jgi:uncharacterized RDD family membrane protein YckC
MSSHSAAAATPSVKRRLTAMLYESLLLLAVDMLAVALWLMVTRNSQAPVAQFGLKVFLFVVSGAYFVYAWTNSGHTLAMKTWRIGLARAGADPNADPTARVTHASAILRYLAAWGWFLPALLVCGLLGLKDKGQIGIALAIGMLAWALTAFLDKDRQFLHDRLAGTRLVSLPKPTGHGSSANAATPAN